eukprot:15473209-Alexandrium_andersonii.AAC.1
MLHLLATRGATEMLNPSVGWMLRLLGLDAPQSPNNKTPPARWLAVALAALPSPPESTFGVHRKPFWGFRGA